MSDPASAVKAAAPALVTATVALRRTVTTPEGNFGAGREVRITKEERMRLTALGFLVDPTAQALPVDIGPRFNYEGPGTTRRA